MEDEKYVEPKELEEKETEKDNSLVEDSKEDNGIPKTTIKQKLIYVFSTIGFAALFCTFYYSSMMIPGYFFPAVMFSYMTVLTALIIVYIVYNRGFSRKGITEEMLPYEWSVEQKREFIENGERRLQKSRWILVFIISIFFTFVAEVFVLFVF